MMVGAAVLLRFVGPIGRSIRFSAAPASLTFVLGLPGCVGRVKTGAVLGR